MVCGATCLMFARLPPGQAGNSSPFSPVSNSTRLDRDLALRSRDRVPSIITVGLAAEKSDSAVPSVDSAAADFAAAHIAAGSEPIGMAAAPLPLPHSRPQAVPCQSLPALCEIRSCFAPGSAPIPEAFWHRTRPTLSPELIPILTVPKLQTRAYS